MNKNKTSYRHNFNQGHYHNNSIDITTPTDANGGMPKYRKGPQRSEQTTKDCKGTLWARLQETGTN